MRKRRLADFAILLYIYFARNLLFSQSMNTKMQMHIGLNRQAGYATACHTMQFFLQLVDVELTNTRLHCILLTFLHVSNIPY